MSNTQPSGGSAEETGGATGIAMLPAIWVGVIIVLAVYGVVSGWPATYSYDLPDSAFYLIYAGLAAAAVNILWGLYLIGLAIGRSARFPRQFTIWQVANIVWILAREIYVLVTPDFIVTLTPLLYAGGEIAIGVVLILLLRRRPEMAAAYSGSETARPPAIVSVIVAVLGIIIGGGLGFGAGLLAGGLIAELGHMSCFEGACGFFAFFVALAGMVAGAIGGGIFAVWRANRRKPAAAA